MKVIFKFETTLRGMLGEKQEEIVLSSAATVEEAWRNISNKYGQMLGGGQRESGNVALPMVIDIQVNGRSITTLQGFQTKLKEGDEITFLPLVTGG